MSDAPDPAIFTPPPSRPEKTPFYESTPFWGFASLAAAAVFTVLGVRMNNLSVFFLLAWAFCIPPVVIFCRGIRKRNFRWAAIILIVIFLALFLGGLDAITTPHDARMSPVVIIWNVPKFIDAQTPLSKRELNATALSNGKRIYGDFEYDPTLGATLSVGTQTLRVIFTPNDPTLYSQKEKTVAIAVRVAQINSKLPAIPTISPPATTAPPNTESRAAKWTVVGLSIDPPYDAANIQTGYKVKVTIRNDGTGSSSKVHSRHAMRVSLVSLSRNELDRQFAVIDKATALDLNFLSHTSPSIDHGQIAFTDLDPIINPQQAGAIRAGSAKLYVPLILSWVDSGTPKGMYRTEEFCGIIESSQTDYELCDYHNTEPKLKYLSATHRKSPAPSMPLVVVPSTIAPPIPVPTQTQTPPGDNSSKPHYSAKELDALLDALDDLDSKLSSFYDDITEAAKPYDVVYNSFSPRFRLPRIRNPTDGLKKAKNSIASMTQAMDRLCNAMISFRAKHRGQSAELDKIIEFAPDTISAMQRDAVGPAAQNASYHLDQIEQLAPKINDQQVMGTMIDDTYSYLLAYNEAQSKFMMWEGQTKMQVDNLRTRLQHPSP